MTDDRENLHKALNELFNESRRLLENNCFSFKEAKKLAAYVAELRMLLDMLWQVEDRLQRDGRHAAAIFCMKERFLELEGMVKEVRNAMEKQSLSRPAC